jgi:hypothetical protein
MTCANCGKLFEAHWLILGSSERACPGPQGVHYRERSIFKEKPKDCAT